MTRDSSFDNFRAISILIILISHCIIFLFPFTQDYNRSYIDSIIFNFLVGGTFFFVFITGYLTPKIFYKKYTFFDFIKSKMKKLIPPYLFISLPFILLFIIFNKGAFKEYSTIEQLILYLTTGRAVPQLWYIPFIILIFLFFPVFKKIDKNFKLLLFIFLFTFLCSLFIQRAPDNVNILQNFMYYLPVYLLGSIVAKKEWIFKNKVFYYFSLLTFTTILLITPFFNNTDAYVSNFFTYNGVDLLFIQKMFFCFILFYLCKRFMSKKNNILFNIANNSFGLFFIHMPIIMALNFLLKYISIPTGLTTFFIISILVYIFSYLTVWFCKTYFPNKSKYMIGV